MTRVVPTAIRQPSTIQLRKTVALRGNTVGKHCNEWPSFSVIPIVSKRESTLYDKGLFVS